METRTSGSGGGPQKRASRKTGTALRAYLTWSRSATARSPTGRSTPAIGVSLDGEKDILGLWAGTGGEWRQVLDERAHRPAQPRREGRVLRGAATA